MVLNKNIKIGSIRNQKFKQIQCIIEIEIDKINKAS